MPVYGYTCLCDDHQMQSAVLRDSLLQIEVLTSLQRYEFATQRVEFIKQLL